MTRVVLRWFLVLSYFAAGVVHLVRPAVFLAIMPSWVPAPESVVALTGIAEIAGSIALAQSLEPRLRRSAGWALAAYALCVWPANLNHMMIDGGANLAYHVTRMALQPILIWAAIWASGAIEWPFRQLNRAK